MKLHYSQTKSGLFVKKHLVLLPYEVTLLSNNIDSNYQENKFYYLMKLHYSQTISSSNTKPDMFYYLMKLHYSQTIRATDGTSTLFYYLMKLHYSQTGQNFSYIAFGFTTL